MDAGMVSNLEYQMDAGMVLSLVSDSVMVSSLAALLAIELAPSDLELAALLAIELVPSWEMMLEDSLQ